MNHLRSLRCFLTARQLRLSLLACLLICLCAAGWWRRVATTASAATAFNTITVNTVVDENGTGANCSLREAIIAANTNAAFGGCPAGAAGLDTIVFNLPAFIQPTINIGSGGAGPLPDITEPVVIDGSSAGRIELNGTSAGVAADGVKLSLFSGGSTLRSLVINRFGGTAIRLTDSSNNVIQNCYLGTDRNGSLAQSNAQYGIHISGGGSNVIGGATASARNVISDGIHLEDTSNNQVLGNYIGTDASGTTALGNGDSVLVGGLSTSSNNIIGGTTPEARNVISGNIGYGVHIANGAIGTQVLGNYIGTSANGLTTLGNGGPGIIIVGGQNSLIGGTEQGAGNLISGNAQSGIHVVSITGPITSGNRIEGNRIGVNATGTAAIPNATYGVSIQGATNTTVGGTAAGAGNLISGNGTFGVYVRNQSGYAATGNRIEGNYIGTNSAGSAAIANGQDGVRIESGGNVVGGTTPEARNIISGNTQHGVFLTGELANDNQIQGNYIGTTPDGLFALGNGLDGVPIVSGANNLIGGSLAGAGNLISGNGRYGVLIQGSLANLNKLEGNYIGTNASGTSAIANAQSGVLIESALNVVGGIQAGSRNVISGNGVHCILLNGGIANGNSIQGNYIGLSADGLSALAPIMLGKYGIQVSNGATNNTIGGTTPEARNTISGQNIGVNFDIGSNANIVRGNYIGTDFTGLNAVPNTVGVYVFRASNNIIGGSSAGAGNVISGNQTVGIALNGAGASAIENSVAGNLIGLKADGLSALGNRTGIDVLSASLTTIGGVSAAERNVISGNFIGIGIRSNNTQVRGNYIGTDLNGTTAIPNTLDGIYLDQGTANYIGGLTVEEGNVISGNGRHGIYFADLTVGSTTGNQILKNRIGTDASGLAPLGNTLDGVHISKSSGNFVGESPDLGNVIAFNGRNGVTIASTGNTINGILNNAIHSNAALGIDLAPLDGEGNPIFGVTANDSGDGDSGPNGLTNFPVLANATAYPFGAGMRLAVQGSLDVPVNSKVQFFRTATCDSSGNGEGQTFLGEISLAYNGSVMNFNQTLTLPAGVILNAGDTITATAISNLGTSEFSACIPVKVPTLTINDISVNEGNSGTTNATFTVTLSNVQGAPGPITVNYSTANGTATAGSDYTATSNTLTFNAPFTQNTITQTINVPVIGDTMVESNETFSINLTGNTGATLAGNQGIATILNDDSTNCSTITLAPASLLNGLTQVAYSQTLSATGGTGAYTFSLTSGALPTGLMLSGNMIIGTPISAGASTFTIRATDDNNCFGEHTYTIVIGSTGLMYYPLARPVRLLDTRSGASPNACNQPSAPITGGSTFTVTAHGVCDGITIPANATTLTGHATMVQPAGNGFLTLFPSDAPQPTVANSNFLAGEVLNNAFTVGLGAADGALKIFTTATSHVVIDVTGYYAPPESEGLYFHPLPKPIRLLETRPEFSGCNATGTKLLAGSTRLQTGVLTCDGVTIPVGAQALVGNATTVNSAGNGFLTLFPANAAQPTTASSNYTIGVNRNAPFTVGLSAQGEFKIFTSQTTDLVIDLVGYYSTQASDINGQGLLFTSLGSPLRLLDTRAGQPACYAPGAPMNANAVYTQNTQIPCTNLTASARASIGNVTTVLPTQNGFLTFWPSNATQPTIATTNYQTGRAFNRHFTVGLGPDVAFKRYSLMTTEVVIDISGFFAP